jgi:hypothetical protein
MLPLPCDGTVIEFCPQIFETELNVALNPDDVVPWSEEKVTVI